VVDGQNTHIESVEEIQKMIKGILETGSDIQNAIINSNTGLFYLPENRFTEKLELLGSIAKMEVI
jgi:5-methyltetrahydropteroyltriglutamate--homocysteine methyltransferase